MRVPRVQDATTVVPPVRKDLNADALFQTAKSMFGLIPDHRTENVDISLADALMSGLAVFSLKDPSLLRFDARRREADPNLKTIYLINRAPCDTQMRDICDGVAPDELRPVFRTMFGKAQRGGALQPFWFLDGHYLISLDGTGFFSSAKLSSASCLTKKSKKSGKTTYELKMLGACLVHPDKKEVLPFFPEMIVNGDGYTKNDCERNAARRWLQKFRQDHPHLKVIITEDALSPNAPHIRDLREHHCRFILGVKPGDHQWLFDCVDLADEAGVVTHYEMPDPSNPKITHRFRFLDDVPLNQSSKDVRVNFLEYWEIGPAGKPTQHFSWVTDLPVTEDTVYSIMRGGRARWRIENETFNTLKNQGYHLGHNFGLGSKHLGSVFAILMMLAFLVDQLQQNSCHLFRALWAKLHYNKASLWDRLRSAFQSLLFDSMTTLLTHLLRGVKARPPDLMPDTS
jgi:hypothetical protein